MENFYTSIFTLARIYFYTSQNLFLVFYFEVVAALELESVGRKKISKGEIVGTEF